MPKNIDDALFLRFDYYLKMKYVELKIIIIIIMKTIMNLKI